MLQGVGIMLRRAVYALLRSCLYPVFSLALVVVSVVLFSAAALWVRWDRWRTRRQLLRAVNARGVKR